MSSLLQKNDPDQDDKMDLENSDPLLPQNYDSNKYSTAQYKHLSNNRKTSKRRQAQQEKAIVLQLFKDLIKVVNQKFQNAYQSPPKNIKLPSKAPKITKNASQKPSKKEENPKKKQDTVSAVVNNHKVDEKPQSRQVSQPAFPSFAQVNHNPPVTTNVSSAQPFQTFTQSPHLSYSIRKSSQHASHRQKSQNEKSSSVVNNLKVNNLKEALKKQIFENYSLQMKYIIHQECEEEVEEVKHGQSGKMIDESSQNAVKRGHKNSKNSHSSENLDDLDVQVISNENEYAGKFLESMKNISQAEKSLINEEEQKCEQEGDEDSSSSSCQQNQKYPPHSHMPEGHASTTKEFLEQHHLAVATLPILSQVVSTEGHQNKSEGQLDSKATKKGQK